MHMTSTGGLRRTPVLIAVVALLVGIAVFIGGNRPAHAANGVSITVNTTADPAGAGCTGGTCSVRQAITVANGDTNDVIHLPELPSGSATVYHTTQGTLPAISAPMTIAGDDPRLVAVDGENAHHVLVVGAPGATVTIIGITVQHGSTNEGAGIITRSTVLNLGNDIIANNVADSENGGLGGGVANESGTLNITHTTFSNNATVQSTNANVGQGGGIYNINQNTALSVLTLTNVTFTGNSAGQGGAVWTVDPANLNNDTLVGNTAVQPVGVAGVTGGGGIFESNNSAQVKITLHNTIVSKNQGGDCGADNTRFISSGHNIDGDNTCNLTGAGDQPSTDPQVAALAFNAPPVIPPSGFPNTMAIGPGSPALDKADNTNCPIDDERGTNRPQNGTCDIGAFEFVPPTPALPKAGLSASSPAPAPGWVGFALLLGGVASGLLVVGRRTARP